MGGKRTALSIVSLFLVPDNTLGFSGEGLRGAIAGYGGDEGAGVGAGVEGAGLF